MAEYIIRTADQLPAILQAFRKTSGLTQSDVASRLGVTQQTLSALERNADAVSAARLIRILHVLGVELVLREAQAPVSAASTRVAQASDW